MNETQLIDELTTALDDAVVSLRMPPGAARRARDCARRRRVARALTATVPAAGLAAALVVAVGVPRQPAGAPGTGRSASPQARPGTGHPALLTVGYVTARAKQAQRTLSKVIVKTVFNGSAVDWSYPAGRMTRYKTYGPGGRLSSDELEWLTGGVVKPPAAVGQTQHRIYVDYASRTWWRLSNPTGTLKDLGGVSGSIPAPQDDNRGVLTILGHRTVNGKDTIEVKYAPPRGFKPTKDAAWATEYIWLDATTYLPVRTTTYDGVPGGDKPATTDFAYLPVTKANLAVFSLTPPAGFKRVLPPPFRGDGRPGLGQIP